MRRLQLIERYIINIIIIIFFYKDASSRPGGRANSSFPFPATPALSYSFGQSCYVKAYNPLKNSAWLVFAKMKLIFARNLNLAKIYKVEFSENTQQ